MVGSYDLVVIGSGTAARQAVARCGEAGWKMAVVDHQPFGGTCVLRGCDPKKVLIGAAEAVDAARRLMGKGVSAERLGIAWPELMAFKRSFTDGVPASMEGRFKSHGVDTFHGQARFRGPNAVTVGDQVLESRYILLAVGAEPMTLHLPGEEHLITSDRFLELEHLPERIVFVGGGYIAFEFAHLSRISGSQVTVLEQAPRVLSGFDPDLVGLLLNKSQDMGIAVNAGTTVKGIERSGDALIVQAVSDGKERHFEADLVVHAAGRVPALGDLDLEAGRVEYAGHRLKLNDFLQSVSNPAVYAAGDAAAAGPGLTPVAGIDASAAAANMLGGNHERPDYTVVPSAVFSIPPLASVGLTEEQARRKGLKFRVSFNDSSSWYNNRRVNETAGYKVLVEEGSERIVGAHVFGPHAEDVINVFALAMAAGLSVAQLKAVLFAYPTASYDIGYMI